mmetsp:Transcript_78854/g.118519  ORF Transcript_78854/g.118519 Transcript_78854/m.118519 type:complete len:163 (-) Transcript_78854:126-614(-)
MILFLQEDATTSVAFDTAMDTLRAIHAELMLEGPDAIGTTTGGSSHGGRRRGSLQPRRRSSLHRRISLPGSRRGSFVVIDHDEDDDCDDEMVDCISESSPTSATSTGSTSYDEEMDHEVGVDDHDDDIIHDDHDGAAELLPVAGRPRVLKTDKDKQIDSIVG